MNPSAEADLSPLAQSAPLRPHSDRNNEAHEASQRDETSIDIEPVRRRTRPLSVDLVTLEERNPISDEELLSAEEQEEWLPFLEEQCRLLTANDANRLDKLLSEVSRDVSVRNSTLYCSMPVLALLRTRIFRCAMLVVSIFYFALMAYNTQRLVRGENLIHAQAVRFTVLEHRDMKQELSISSMSDLSLTMDSCPISSTSNAYAKKATNDSLTLWFKAPVTFNGWRFSSANADRSKDVRTLRIEASSSIDGTMSVVGAPVWDVGFSRTERPQWELPLASEEGQQFDLGFSRPIALAVGQILVPAIVGLNGLMAAWLAGQNRIMRARALLSVGMVTLSTVALAVFAALVGQRQWDAARCWSATVAASLLLACAIVWAPGERFLPSVLGLNFVVVTSLLVVNRLLDGVPDTLLSCHELYLCCVGAAVSVFLLDKRRKMLDIVQSGVREDRSRYDDAWKEAVHRLSQEEATGVESEMHLLLECVRDCSFGHVKRPTQTLISAQDRSWSAFKHLFPTSSSTTSRTTRTTSASHAPSWSGSRTPVNSLDQLYAQAQGCQRIMRSKARELLASSRGLVPITGRSEAEVEGLKQVFLPWSEVHDDAEMQALVQWTPLKPIKRAVEKVVHHYHGDVSRLTDVCREMLVFDSLSGITACLRAMDDDPEIVLELVRSNLAPHQEAGYSAGFRCVVVKFRIVTKLTETFGVDGHVCEFLLVPHAIAKCMSNASHEKYLQLRELRDFQGAARLLSCLSAWRPTRESAKSAAAASGPSASRSLDGLIASLHFKNPSSAARSRSGGSSRTVAATAALEMPVARRTASDPALARTEEESTRPRALKRSSTALSADEASRNGRGKQPPLDSSDSWERMGFTRVGSTATAQASVASTARSLTLTRTQSSYDSNAWRRASSAFHFARSESCPQVDPTEEEAQEKLSRLGALLALYRRSATEQPGRLDREVKQIDVAVAHADHVSVFATSFPIAAAMCKPWFLWPVLLIAVGHLLSASSGLARLSASGRIHASALRLHPHVSNAQQSIAAQNLWESNEWQFGALVDGCRMPLNRSSADDLLFELGGELVVHGVFVTSTHSTTLPPLSFSVEACVDGGHWIPIGAPEYSIDAFMKWSSRAEGDGRGADVEIDFLAAWFVWAGMPASSLTLSVTWFVVAGCALNGKVRWGRPVLIGGLSGACLLWVLSAVGFQLHQQAEEQLAHWGEPLVLGMTVSVIVLREQLLLEAMLFLGLSNVVLRAVLALSLHDTVTAVGLHSAEWMCLTLLALVLLIARARATQTAKKRIEQDMRAYDTAWSQLVDDPTHDAAIDAIQRVTRSIQIVNQSLPQTLLQTFWLPESDRSLKSIRHRPSSPTRLRRPRSRSPSPRTSLSPPRNPSACSDRPAARKLSSEYSLPQAAAGKIERLSWRLKKNSSERILPSTWSQSSSRRQSRETTGSAGGSFGRGFQPPHFSRCATDSAVAPASAPARHSIMARLGSGPGRPSQEPSWLRPGPADISADQAACSCPSPTSSNEPPSSAGGSPLAMRGDLPAFWKSRLPPRFREEGGLPGAEAEGAGVEGTASVVSVSSTAIAERPRERNPRAPTSPQQLPQRSALADEDEDGGGLEAAVRKSGARPALQVDINLDDAVSCGSQAPSPHSHPSAWQAPSPSSMPSSLVIRERFLSARTESGAHGSRRESGRSWRNWRRTTSDGVAMGAMRRGSLSRFASADTPRSVSPSSSFVMRMGSLMSTIPSSPLQTLLGTRGRSELDTSVRLVESLDQLYAQAAVLYPVLKHKVQQWAVPSEGMFPVGHKADHRYVRWSQVVNAGDDAMVEQVRWAHLKGPQRAIEKLSRSYQGRVAHLLDVCRQSIVFETPAALADCLSVLAADPEISICKIMNRFDRDYNSRKSLGYRDVNVNLRIDTEETRRLGVENHICEVQMLLRTFAELKSNEGHKRYVAFRNARGQ